MDITRTTNRDLPDVWQLPDDIRPEDQDAGFPTQNLLGYGPASVLTPIQIQWLVEAGFNEAGDYVLEMRDMPLMLTLLVAVQTELSGTRCKLVPLTAEETGSTAQSVTVTTPPGGIAPVREARTLMVSIYGIEVSGPVVVASKSLRYLHKHVVDDDVNSWSVYEWDGFSNVPDEWKDTANTLYDLTGGLLMSYSIHNGINGAFK